MCTAMVTLCVPWHFGTLVISSPRWSGPPRRGWGVTGMGPGVLRHTVTWACDTGHRGMGMGPSVVTWAGGLVGLVLHRG